MVATEIIALHSVSMDFLARASRADHMATNYADAARKMLDTLKGLVELINGKNKTSEQNVNVRHIQIGDGSQAVVGIVNPKGEGVGRKQ